MVLKELQQKSGFRTEKESNAARDNTIGKLHAGTYIVYENVKKVSDFLEFWLKEDICKRVRSEETYAAYSNIVYNHIIPILGKKKMSAVNRGDVQKAV